LTGGKLLGPALFFTMKITKPARPASIAGTTGPEAAKTAASAFASHRIRFPSLGPLMR